MRWASERSVSLVIETWSRPGARSECSRSLHEHPAAEIAQLSADFVGCRRDEAAHLIHCLVARLGGRSPSDSEYAHGLHAAVSRLGGTGGIV